MINKEILCKSLWIQLLLLSVMGILVYNVSLYAEDTPDDPWFHCL